jgi:glycine oxidase
METDRADVTIIGAGVIGCATAYFLSKEGVKVIVVEQDSIGSHASGFAPGVLNPFGLAPESADIMLPLTWQSFQIHKVLAQELKRETGIDYYFRQSGRITLAFTQAEADEIKAWVNSQRQQGFKVCWLDSDDVHAMESRVSPEIIGAAYSEDSADLDSYRYVLALAQAAEKYGAEIRYGRFTGLKSKGEKVTGIQLTSSDIACERTILAMGPWTGLASSLLGFQVPVKPQKGQTLRIRASGPPFSYILNWDTHYNTGTKRDGLIYAGATHEDAGFNEETTEEGRDKLISNLVTIVPSLAEAELVLQTACLRPFSADGLPIIGEVPGWSGVYLATGHWKKGILLSTVTARIMADLIVKGFTPIPFQPFAPARFTGRES